MTRLRASMISFLSVGSPGKAGPSDWRYIHFGSKQITGPS